jgi:hypothetical protein
MPPSAGALCNSILNKQKAKAAEPFFSSELFVAIRSGGVYTGPDESPSSLKGIKRSRNLPMEVGVSQRE